MINFQKIFDWALTLFVLFIIFQVIRKILGGSWGFEELASSLLIANFGYYIALHKKISSIDSKLSEHMGWHKGKDQSTLTH